jgi:DNA-directed RNA polymerase sigma subunit (sigma70/sigma32)
VKVDQKEKDYRNQASKDDNFAAEMVLVRIGGKWQYITRKMLEQARKVMRALEPLEREVLRLKFGLPPEYFEELENE